MAGGVYFEEAATWIDRFTGFRRHFVDEVVPFLAVALHNSVRYHRNADALAGRRGALRTLAWGAMPFMEISARTVPGAHAHGQVAVTKETI